jgi:transcriptional regulator CtsR
MRLNELVRTIPTWLSNEEQQVLDRIKGLEPASIFSEREQQIIENLVRKSLVIAVTDKGNTYLYPNV